MKTTVIEEKENRSDYPETADIETSSDDYAGRFAGAIGDYFLGVQSRLTLDLLESFKGGNVLDVGGGHAQLAVPLVNNGFKVTVVGSSDACRMRLDRFLAAENFRYQTCDMLKLPFQDKQFDVVIAFRLLPHVDRWQELIREMCRVAGKAVIVDYPDIRSFNILYKMFFKIKKTFEGNTRTFRSFSRKEILEVFKENGFDHPRYKPEFFFPMVIHRLMKSVSVSKNMENMSGKLGLNRLFGTPIILRVNRSPQVSP